MGEESSNGIIGWDKYPDPRLKLHRGVWTVFVSIPRSIRHLFGKKGVSTELRRVAGESESEARKNLKRLSYEIYEQMDLAQEGAIKNKDASDKFWEMQAEDFKRDNEAEIDFNAEDAALKFIATFSSILTPRGSSANSLLFKQADRKRFPLFKGFSFTKRFSKESPYEMLSELKTKCDLMANMVKSNPERYTKEEQEVAQDYLQPDVRSYLEDLITDSAKVNLKEVPNFSKPKEEDFWYKPQQSVMEDQIPPSTALEQSTRERRSTNIKMSELRGDYLNWVEKLYRDKSSKNKIRLGFDEFISLMGDLDPKKIDAPMAVGFADSQLEEHTNRSHKTIKDRNWAMGVFTDYCFTKRYMTVKPFFGAKLKKYGTIGGNWLEYQDSDLDRIFKHRWDEQELLLLKIGLATGMRIGEIALLTWERIKNTNEFQYISLLDEGEEKASVKNVGSKRLIPIHPDLKLPQSKNGRIFNYTIDTYGKATTSAGRSVNSILAAIVEDSFRKSFHSFRSTFIIKMQEAEVPEDIRKLITGHGAGDTHHNVYGGVGAQTRFNSIRKLNLPWLKYGSE